MELKYLKISYMWIANERSLGRVLGSNPVKLVFNFCTKFGFAKPPCLWCVKSVVWENSTSCISISSVYLLRGYYELKRKIITPNELDSPIGRVVLRFHGSHGFESRSFLDFFRLSFRSCVCNRNEWPSSTNSFVKVRFNYVIISLCIEVCQMNMCSEVRQAQLSSSCKLPMNVAWASGRPHK